MKLDKEYEKRMDELKRTRGASWPNRVFVTITKDNSVIARSMMPQQIGAPNQYSVRRLIFDQYMLKKLMPKYKFCMICDLVDETNITESRDNGRKNEKGGPYPWQVFVMINSKGVHPTKEALRNWGKDMAVMLQYLGSQKWPYPFEYAGTIQPRERLPLSCYLKVQDVFKVMNYREKWRQLSLNAMLEEWRIASLYFTEEHLKVAKQFNNSNIQHFRG